MSAEDLLSFFILIILFIAAVLLFRGCGDEGSIVGFNIIGEK